MGHNYGVIVDRFSNWFQIWHGQDLSLVQVLTSLCRDFGVPETLTSDGGPQFVSETMKDFMRQHGITHRLTSVAFPHANCRAEVAVKSAKRMIRDNVGPDGRPDGIKLTRALLQHRNTPDRAIGMSPAGLLLGRQLRDFLPGSVLAPPLCTFADLRPTWQDVAAWREKALCRRSTKDHERLCARTADLPPLSVGQPVLVQNQADNHPRQWDRRGTVVAALLFRQYQVRLDGSRRLTLRNRKFLRTFVPVSPAALAPPGLRATASPPNLMPSYVPPHVVEPTQRPSSSAAQQPASRPSAPWHGGRPLRRLKVCVRRLRRHHTPAREPRRPKLLSPGAYFPTVCCSLSCPFPPANQRVWRETRAEDEPSELCASTD